MGRRRSSRIGAGPWFVLPGLLAVLAVAAGLRGLLVPQVVSEEGVFFERGDSQYHLRRAYYTFRNFPSVLMHDTYINHPDGAPIAWPPLYDFAVGGAARLLAEDDRGFERVAAWVNPWIGAFTCIPVFLLGRRLGGAAVGLGGAALYALFPVGVFYSHVGNVDHHALVALLGACLLAACVRAADPRPGPRRTRNASSAAATVLALALARSALMLTWHGSFLYLALAETGLFAVGAATGRARLFALEAASLAATLAVIGPVVAISPVPLGGSFSAIALSWLHVLALFVLAVSAATMARVAAHRFSARGRFAALAVLAASFLLVLLAIPAVRVGLEPAVRFLTMNDAMGMQTAEQRPLLPLGLSSRSPGFPPLLTFGFLVWALPFVPFALAWRFRRPGLDRAPGLLFAGWTGLFTLLAIGQYRYANDLGPAACAAFALLIAGGLRRLDSAERTARFFGPRSRVAVALALGPLLLAPPIAGLYRPWFARAVTERSGDAASEIDPVTRSLRLFLEDVRRATPETSGYLDGRRKPEYGIVADADLGHAIQYMARRATPTDPFWSYIGETNWQEAHGLLHSPDEQSALSHAAALRVRYIVTMGRGAPGTFAHRLHAADGLAPDAGRRRPFSHLRLVTEGPRGGVALPATRTHAGIPYKLFEFVEGARLEVEAPVGSPVEARARIRTAAGRHFVYEVSAPADSDGVARLRLPYASESDAPTRPTGPWRVRTGGREALVSIGEFDVVEGRARRLPGAAFTERGAPAAVTIPASR